MTKRFEPNEQDKQRAARLMEVLTMFGTQDKAALERAFAEVVEQWREDQNHAECELGRRVIDTITGFAGVATSRVSRLHSCPQVLVEAAMLDGKVQSEWFDQQRLAYSEEFTGTPLAKRHA